MTSRENGCVSLPKWLVGIIAFLLATAISAMVAWGVNSDSTQRRLLQDVSSLQEHRENVLKQLDRIETKLDKLLDNKPR